MTQRIGALSVELSAESAAFKADLTKARQAVAQATTRMERDFKGVERGLGGLDAGFSSLAAGAGRLSGALGALGVGLSAVGFAQMVRGALDAAGGLGELAEQAGTSTDALQILTYAGTQFGVSAEQVQGGLEKLTRRLGDAAAGNDEAANSFHNLGIRFLEANGTIRPTERVLVDIADAISRIEDPAERARVAVEFFGRTGQKLLPILSQGRAGFVEIEEAARRAGAVLSGDTVSAADNAGDKIAELTLRMERLQQRFAAGISPAILAGLQTVERALDRLTTLAGNPSLSNFLNTILRAGGEGLQHPAVLLPGSGTIGRGLSALGREPTTELQDAERALADVQRRLDDLRGRGASGTDPASIGRFNTSVERLNGQLTEAQGKVDRLRGTPAPQTFSPTAEAEPEIPLPPPAAPPVPKGSRAAAQQPQLAAYIAQLQQAAEAQRAETALVNESAGARAAAVALIEAEARARDDAAKGLRSSAQLTDAEREAVEAAARSRATLAEVERSASQMREEATRVTENARTEEEKFADSVRRLQAMLEQRLITQETFNRAVANLKAPAEAATNEMARFGDIASSAFEDALAGGKSFSDILRGLEQDLLKLGTRILVTQPLGDWFSGQMKGMGGGQGLAGLFTSLGSSGAGKKGVSGGGGGDWIGSAFSFIASLFHSGGMVGAGGVGREVPVSAFAGAPRYHSGGIAGMRPDEVPAILQTGERVLSRDEVRRGAGGMSVVMNISTPDANSFRASEGQIAASASRALARSRRNL